MENSNQFQQGEVAQTTQNIGFLTLLMMLGTSVGINDKAVLQPGLKIRDNNILKPDAKIHEKKFGIEFKKCKGMMKTDKKRRVYH